MVVPSQAAGVIIGGSVSVNPRSSKKSRAALMISARTRRIAAWRWERTHRWRCSIRKSTPCSLGVIGIRIVLGDPLHDLNVGDVEFVAAGRALVGTDLALDNHARLLREAFDRIEHFRRDGILGDDALNDAGAVAKLRKQEFPAFAQVVKPAANGDGLAVVLADFRDSGNR